MIEFLYSVIALELFTGGGGRLLELGSVTVRMVLFVLGLIATIFMLLMNMAEKKTFAIAMALVFGLFFTHFPAFLIGYLKGATSEDIFTDFSPLLFWLIAPFFAAVLEREHMVLLTAKLIQVTAVAMALCYLCLIASLAIGAINYGDFYVWGNSTGEIFFRNESLFFYKGFIYLGIGVIFIAALGGPWRGVWLTIVIVALILTLTRGLILATSMAGILLMLLFSNKRAAFAALCVTSIALFVVFVYLPSLDDGYLLGQREISNSVRVDDFNFIIENISLSFLHFGEGMGTYINGRLSIENSFLMILWKMGLFAFLFWLIPLFLALYYFLKIKKISQHFRIACAFFVGVILIYIQTSTNPYLNNPIGLSFVIMAIFSLRTISQIICISVIDT